MSDFFRVTLLFDFYGELLTEKQRNVLEMYYLNDLSLSEIALELGISRQGVRDQLIRGERLLNEYEDKLRLLERYEIQKAKLSKIKSIGDEIIDSTSDNSIKGKALDIISLVEVFFE